MDTICICGEAGSGKDTVADLLREHLGTDSSVKLALADPMKRLTQALMGFTDLQLWGPSDMRNAADERITPTFIADLIVKVMDYKESPEKTAVSHLLNWVEDNLGVEKSQARAAFLGWLRFMAEKAESGPLSPRVVLQTLGTEFGRAVDPGIWIKMALENREILLQGGYAYTAQKGLIPDSSFFINTVLITDIRFRNELLAFRAIGADTIRVLTGKPLPPATHASELEQRSIPDTWFKYVIVNKKEFGLDALKRMMEGFAANLRPSRWQAEYWQ